MRQRLLSSARGSASVCAVAVLALGFLSSGAFAAPLDDDQLPLTFTLGTNPHTLRGNSISAGGGVLGHRSNGSVLGVDSLPNWSSYFYDPGVDSSGFPQFTWQYTMVGRSPFTKGDDDDRRGKTTSIGSPVVPVNVDLRNFDGSPRSWVRRGSSTTRRSTLPP